MLLQAVGAPSAPASDLDLIERARGGDSGALEPLMRRHNRTLYRTARAILRDDADAEDAVQDAYLQAFRNLAAFKGESSFSTWLVRIVANEALMRRRRNVRRSEVIPINHEIGETMIEEIAQDPAIGPEGLASGAQMRRLLERRIDALPDLYRAVFVMRAVEDMSVEETAAALDLAPATVRIRFFRARALLRSGLERDVDHALLDVFAFAGERCDRIVAGVMRDYLSPIGT
jgi:RNA polymerase sigma-70 factor (ECF subfamily)